MVLSNAERQARFQKRMREKLAQGVTPEMVDQVARITWDCARREDDSLPSWDDMLANCRTRLGRSAWFSHMEGLGLHVPSEEDALADYGADADLVRRVCLVLRSALIPPLQR